MARQILKPCLINNLNRDLEKLQNSLMYPRNILNYNDCDLEYAFENELTAHNIISERLQKLEENAWILLKFLCLN